MPSYFLRLIPAYNGIFCIVSKRLSNVLYNTNVLSDLKRGFLLNVLLICKTKRKADIKSEHILKQVVYN